jgi:hypothetical protein
MDCGGMVGPFGWFLMGPLINLIAPSINTAPRTTSPTKTTSIMTRMRSLFFILLSAEPYQSELLPSEFARQLGSPNRE